MWRSAIYMLRLFVFCMTICLILPHPALAVGKKHLTPVLPDSSNFITASVLYYSPLDNYQSILGHTAIRMQCPSEGFDVIFGLEVDFDTFSLAHLIGRYKVGVSRTEADSHLHFIKKEGRQVVECPLNLTHHEKQRLWMLLDKESEKSPDDCFCLVKSQCASVVINNLQQCTIKEYIDFGQSKGPLAMKTGDYFRWIFRDSPWYRFVFVTLSGDNIDKNFPSDRIICAELMIPILQHATLRNSDDADSITVRPLVTDSTHEILPLVTKPKTSKITPMMVFVALLVVTLIITVAEWRFHLRCIALYYDRILFGLYSLWSLAVIWFAVIGVTLTDSHWNWYIIPFNPIPVIIWALGRKRPKYKKVFLLYAIVLILFLLMTPLSSQIDLEHQLITASLAIRCLSIFMSKNRKD